MGSLVLPLRLSDRLDLAQPGDWCVLEIEQQRLLWEVVEISPSLLLREIEAPAAIEHDKNPSPSQWAEWVTQQPFASKPYRLFRRTVEGPWITRHSEAAQWNLLPAEDSLIARLLDQELAPVDTAHQRRVGPRPRAGLPDERPVWRPPLARSLPSVEVWSTRIAGENGADQQLLLTLWTAPAGTSFPPLFPLHVEIQRVGVQFRIHTLAAGRWASVNTYQQKSQPLSASTLPQ